MPLMASIQHSILLILFSTHTYALVTTTPLQSQDNSDNPWSTEAILGLAAIVVAVICCIVSLACPTVFQRYRWRRASQSLLPQSAYVPGSFGQQPWLQHPVIAHHHYYVRVDRADILMGGDSWSIISLILNSNTDHHCQPLLLLATSPTLLFVISYAERKEQSTPSLPRPASQAGSHHDEPVPSNSVTSLSAAGVRKSSRA
ncbi:hypothetical protein C7974DRAFT_378732 [Boeremia exigua]|uniref:uncharacterized protein n=1 Tax=Boeremia exigua TaxID=749465 RepID=UPI001E8E4974|nr:uncharacterized protein C7974DRAFT_378732 [Boeremia exigua]KAH6618541.1 hypothetical protein C7974DRAFT_378732 [Boeremia exigua]